MSDENLELVIVARFPTEMEAAQVVAEFERQGIAVTMTGGFTAGFIAEAPGDVQIKVLEKDEATAKEILAKFEASNEEIDWDKVDVGDKEST